VTLTKADIERAAMALFTGDNGEAGVGLVIVTERTATGARGVGIRTVTDVINTLCRELLPKEEPPPEKPAGRPMRGVH
jgi:hypothetical protein